MIPLNYHHLYYFYMVARSGSIAKACKTLLLSQPAVSTQLGQLERALGSPLFERKKQRLHLTEEGRFVLDYAEGIFEMGKELQDNLKDRPSTGKASIRVGILSGTARAFGHALLESILDRFPSVHVGVREGELEELLLDLKDQRVDMLLTLVSVHGHGQGEFLSHLVGKVPIVFAAAPGIARRYRRIPRDLNDAPFILPSKPSHVYHQILDRLAEWKVEPRTIVEVQDADLARNLAISGRGIAPLNAYTVSLSTPAKALTVLGSRKTLGLFESVYLVSRKRKWVNPVVAHLLKNFRLPTRAK
ncbi:LysR family transcriptional regulator [Elusimicrobiota bacterium]